jgi:ABC-type lipoprotein release transport system permease subunit
MNKPKIAVMAWRNLWRNRRRTLITLSSIVFGVSLSILFTALQDYNWADMINLAARLGGGHVTIQHHEYLETPSLTRTVRNVGELSELASRDERVRRVVARISGQTMLATAGESYGAGFLAFDPDIEDVDSLSLLEAVVEGNTELEGRTTGILLGSQLAINLGADIGDRVVYTMTDKDGEIVSGLARLAGTVRTGSPSVDNGMALLPISRVRQVLGYDDDEATQVAVFVGDQRQSAAVAAALNEAIGLAIGADDQSVPQSGPGVVALPWSEVQPDLATFISMKVGGAVFMEIFIAILVCAGIFNTLFVNVMERLREFGIMLAVGFSQGVLFRMVMLESLWLGLVGLAAAAAVVIGPYLYLANTGISLAGYIGEGGTDIAGVAISSTIRVGIYAEHAVAIALFALIATMLAGLYPAWRAGRVSPADTIRVI